MSAQEYIFQKMFHWPVGDGPQMDADFLDAVDIPKQVVLVPKHHKQNKGQKGHQKIADDHKNVG